MSTEIGINEPSPQELEDLRADCWKLSDTFLKNKMLSLVDTYEDRGAALTVAIEHLEEIANAFEEIDEDKLPKTARKAFERLSKAFDVAAEKIRAAL